MHLSDVTLNVLEDLMWACLFQAASEELRHETMKQTKGPKRAKRPDGSPTGAA